ncbi:hypothetical protein M3Y97_00623000 [Aphelenchoides bicaudatus]|nr:hypothetical protein M3Y97_00623000 [Aphelenchoides bicaudatus]
MDNVGNQICGRVQLFVVCVTQCFCLGFDFNFLTLFLHIKLIGPLLLVGSCIFNGCILVGSLVVWMNGYAKFDVWACVFGLLSLKVISLCILALDLFDFVFLSFIGCVGFCIGSKQALIFDLVVRRIPNPAKKLLVQLCFASYSLGNLASALFYDQNAPGLNEQSIVAPNQTTYHSIYKSFNILLHFQINLRVTSSCVIVALAVIQCFLGYCVYDLWKRESPDSQPETEETEPVVNEYARNVERISSGFAFFSSGLISIFPYYVFGFALTDNSAIFFYAFLLGCLASRLLLLAFACKFPPMFWLCSSLVICGVSICCSSFEELRLFYPALFGMGLSMILPSNIMLISKHKGTSIHPLFCGSIASSLIYPILVTYVMQTYGSELFTTINFFTLLIMVVLFVCFLNVQSITEKPQDEKHARIWIFFQGQGIKRVHSVRKFVSAFRESLRSNNRSYRRLRRFQRSPQPDSNLIENPLATYRSVESARKSNLLQLTRRLYNSIDEEIPSNAVGLSPMPSEEPSQISSLDYD